MSESKRKSRRWMVLSTAAAAAVAGAYPAPTLRSANAALVYWDSDANGTGNTTAGAGLGGSGSWNNSTSGSPLLNWWPGTGTTDQSWVNANNDTAVFVGTAGTVTLTDAITAGGLTFSTAGYVISGGTLTLNETAPGAAVLSVGANATISSVLAGGGNLTGVTVSGTSGRILTLTGANTYTVTTTVASAELDLNTSGGPALEGNLTVSGGTVKLLQSNQVVNTASLVVSAGTLNLGANSNTVAGLTLTGGSILGTTGVLTSTTAYNVQGGTVSAILGGAVALNKTGAGTVTLSGANTYSGGTSLAAGVLRATTSATVLGTGPLSLSGGELQLASDTGLAFGYNTTLTGNAQITVDRLTSGAGITQTLGTLDIGAQRLTVSAGGNVTSGTAGLTFSGPTTLSAPATFIVNSNDNANASLSLNAINTNGNLVTFAGSGNTLVSGVIGGGAGGLNKSGAGFLTLTAANTYAGLTNVSGGELDLNSAGGPAISGNLTISGGRVKLLASNQIVGTAALNISGDFNLGANSNTFASVNFFDGSITGTTGVLTSNSPFNVQNGLVSAILAGSVGMNKSGPGTVTLSGANTFTGDLTINSGAVIGAVLTGNPFGGGSINLISGTLGAAPAVAGAATPATANAAAASTLTYGAGTIALTANGANTLTFTLGNAAAAANSVLVRSGAGTLVIDPALGTAATNLGVHEKLIVNGGVPVTNGIVSASIVGQNNDPAASGDFLNYGSNGFVIATYADTNFAAPSNSKTESISAPQTLTANKSVYAIRVGASDNITLNNNVALSVGSGSGQAGVILNGATIQAGIGQTNTSLAFGAAEGVIYANAAGGTINLPITGTGGVTEFGPGTLFLTGANTFTGPLSITGGHVAAISPAALGNPSNTVQLNAGTLSFDENATFNQGVSVGSGGGTIDVSLGKNAAYYGPSFALSGGAPASTTLTKTGPGTLFINSPNAFTGAIVLGTSGGTVQVRGATGTVAAPTPGAISAASSITINPASTLLVDNQNSFGAFANTGTLAATSSLNRIADTIPITMNGGALTYSAANLAGNVTETLGTVTLNAGYSTLTATANGQGSEIAVTSLVRNFGATVNFAGTGALGTAGNNGRIFLNGFTNNGSGASTLSTTGGLIGGWALVNSSDFAGYTTPGAGVGGVGVVTYSASFGPGLNTNLTGSVTAAGGVTSTGTLRLSGNATNINFNLNSDTLNIENGGILANNANEAHTIGGTANDTAGLSRGVLTAGGTTGTGPVELFVHQNQNTITINSFIQDNGNRPLTLIKDGGGAMTITGVALLADGLTEQHSTYSGGTLLTNSGDVTVTPTLADQGALGTGAVTVNNTRLVINSSTAAVVYRNNPNAWNLTTNPTYLVNNTGALQFNAGGLLPMDALNNLNPNQQTIRLTGNSELSVASNVTAGSLVFSGPGQNVRADAGSVIAESAALSLVDATGALQPIGLPSTPTYYFGVEGTLTDNITVGPGTPWLGISSGRGGNGTYSGGTTGTANNTITYNGDFALQGFLFNNTYRTLQLGNGTGTGNVVQISPGTGVTSANANVSGNLTLNNDQSIYQGLTFVMTPGSTLLLNTANALGGGGTANAGQTASVIMQAGSTLNLNGGLTTSINGSVTFLAGSTFQADDTVAGGPFQGTGTLTFLPGSYITLSGTGAGTVNALSGSQFPSQIPAGVIIRLNNNTTYGNGLATIGTNGLPGKVSPTQIFEAISGTNFVNTITTATGTSNDNMTLSGGLLTAGVTGGTINQGGGRIIVGAGGITLAGGATVFPTNGNNGNATFSLQEDFDLSVPGAAVNVGFNGIIDGQPKFGSYVALTGQGSRSVSGGAVNLVAGTGTQLQVSAFYTIPDLAVLNVGAGTSVLLNTANAIETVGALNGAGTIAANQGGATLQVGYDNAQPSAFDGIFAAANTAGVPFSSQQPNLTKIGTNTLALTGASTSTGTLTTIGGETVLTGATGSVKFATITLGRGDLKIDDAGTALANRLGGVGGATPAGPTLNLAGGDLTLSGPASEIVGGVGYSFGGVSNLNLGVGTLNVVTNNGARSITTVLVHGTKLGAGSGNATFTANAPGLAGSTTTAGQITAGIRSDILTDSNSAGGTLVDPTFVTYDTTANSYRGLTAAEVTSNLYSGQNLSNNVLLSANTSLTFPQTGGIPNQLPALGIDTQLQSLTLASGVSLSQAATLNAIGGQARLNVNASGIIVQADNANAGSAVITAPFISGSGFIYVNDAGKTGTNSLTINSTIVNGSGTAAIVVAGAGNVTFGPGAINFYDQPNFAVNGPGAVKLAAGNSLFFNSTTGYLVRNVWLAGGTLDLGGNGQVVGTFSSSNTLSQPLNSIIAGNVISTGGNADLVTTGSSNFYGTLSGIGNLTREGNTTTNFRNSVSMAGDLTVRGGTLVLQDLGKITGTQNVVLDVASLQLDNVDSPNFNQKNDYSGPVITDRIPSTAAITMRGSQLRFRSAPGIIDAQTFGSTGDLTTDGTGTGVRLDSGANEIFAEANGNSSANVTIANLVRPNASHAFANFTGSNIGNTGEGYQVSHFVLSNLNGQAMANSGATGAANSIIAPWAIVAGDNFATYSTAGFTSGGLSLTSRGLAALGNTANGYAAYETTRAFNAVTGTTATTLASDIISNGGSVDVLGVTSRTIGALRINNGANAAALTLNTPELLTVALGGIIINNGNAATVSGGSITSGYLQPGGTNNELYLWTNQNTTTLSSAIVDNGSTPVAFIKGGAGSLVFNGTNAFTGGAYFSQGTTTLSGSTLAIPLSAAALNVPDITLTGNVTTATTLIANTNAQIAPGAKVELDGFATLRLNDTAAGTQVLNGITFNNHGGTAAPLVQVAGTVAGGTLQLNGNITVNNFNLANVPTIAQNLGTAATTPAVLDLAGATHTIDVEGQSAVGSSFIVNGQSVTGLNIQLGIQNGGIIKTGGGTLGIGVVSTNLTGGASTSTLTGGITINAGVVRADSAGALGPNGTLSGTSFAGGNTVTVNPGATLLANTAGATFTGNIALLGGTLQAINSTETFSGPVVFGAGAGNVNPTVAEQDFFYTGTVNRSITLAGQVAVSGTPTINVTAAPFAGSTGTLLFSNPLNSLAGATIAIGPNAIVTAKNPVTPFTGNPISGAAITMSGGQLNVNSDGTNPAFGNNVTVSGPAQVVADRASASTNQTLTMGSLTLQAGYQLFTATANNGYTLSFTSTSVPTAPLNLNVTAGTLNTGTLSGAPTAITKFGAGTLAVPSWAPFQSLNSPVTIAQGVLRTTSGNGTTALTAGALNIVYGGTLYNDSAGTNKVTYSPSSLSSQGLIQSHTGNMNLSGYLLRNASQTVSLSPEFSNVSERWFNTLGANAAADDALITLSTASGNFLNAPPTAAATTGVLKDQFLDFTDAQARARGRTNTNLMGALITGTFTPTTTGAVSFGLNTDDGSTLYLNWENPGAGLTFTTADLIVSNLGAHSATVATGATPVLQAGTAYPFAIGYYNSGGGGLLEARYSPGVVGNGPIATNGAQPVPFANQVEINPGKTPNTQLQVDANATLTTSGFNAETVLLNGTTTTGTPSTLVLDAVTAGPNSTTIPTLSTAQILYADSATAGSVAKIDIAANKAVNVTQSIGVNSNVNLTKSSGGTLFVNSAANTGVTASPGTLTISGGVVGGQGVLTVGSVVVNSGTSTRGGTISAGVSSTLSPGTGLTDTTANLVTTGGQTWVGGGATGATGGVYAWKLNVNNVGQTYNGTAASINTDKTGANWDQLTMTSLTVSASSTARFNIEILPFTGTGSNAFDVTKSYQWAAANSAAAPTGLVASAFNIDTSNFLFPNLGTFGISQMADSGVTDIIITYNPAPEPTSLGLLGLGAAGLLLRRRRRTC